MKKKLIAGLCALLLIALLGTVIPSATAADQLFFTAVNETVLSLDDATMPFFSGGNLYVPYTIFDAAVTGENVGVFTSYSRAKGAVLIYNLSGSLLFDLNEKNSVYNGTAYPDAAILRNSTVFVPINAVCRYFNLDWAWLFATQGSVIRLKSSSASLSDRDFAAAASYTLSERLRVYLQSKEGASTPTPSVSPSPTPTATVTPRPPATDGADVRFAFLLSEEAATLPDLLNVLDQSGVYALFLLRPDDLLWRDDHVRTLLARGHKIGFVLDAETVENQRYQMQRGLRRLSAIAHAHTSICLSVGLTDEELHSLGPSFLFWESSVDISPRDGRTPTAQVKQVSDTVVDNGDYFVLMNDSAQSVLVLDRVLDALSLKGCDFPPVTEFSLIG